MIGMRRGSTASPLHHLSYAIKVARNMKKDKDKHPPPQVEFPCVVPLG